MKKSALLFFVVALSALPLAGCGLTDGLTMPRFSSLNPFSRETAQAAPADAAVPSAPSVSTTALETEMNEMAFIMDSVPRPGGMASVPATEALPVEETAVAEPVQAQTEPTTPRAPERKPAQQARTVSEPTIEPVEPETIPVNAPAATVAVNAQEMETVQEETPPPATVLPVRPVETLAAVPPQEEPERPAIEQAEIVEQPAASPIATTDGCPSVTILPTARSLTYFENDEPGPLVARASIAEIRGGCEIVSGGMEIDLDIIMDGKIGEKGRFEGRKDTESFLTFPYFVAISDPQGLPVDKKIMAAAVRFPPVTDQARHAEKITQFVPMDNPRTAGNYSILVGFQLNRKQLEYNRGQNLNRVDNQRVAPDLLRNPSRRSFDPLAE